MKTNIKSVLFAALTVISSSLFLLSCQDEISSQGSSLVSGVVSITVDSVEHFIPSRAIPYTGYDARSLTKLLGRINVEQYGSLNCAFMSQLYPSPVLGIPDSITVEKIDSLRFIFSMPRGAFTGDSLAPQYLKIYRLENQLTNAVDNNADPADYCNIADPSALIGQTSYTLSALGLNDSIFRERPDIRIPVKLSQQDARKVFNAYKESPQTFEWPANLAQKFPGIFVEQSFGSGCIANISNLDAYIYWTRQEPQRVLDEDTGVYNTIYPEVRDSVCLFTSVPEVISTNIIKYTPSQYIIDMIAENKAVNTTPGGFFTEITFPADKIVDKYNESVTPLTVVSNLSMRIPAEAVENEFGLKAAPYLLMVKSSEREDFFKNNRVPDGITSFYAAYNESEKAYSFNSLRQYILNIIDSGKPVEADDMMFSLVPVMIETESSENYYGQTTAVYVTRCANYTVKPTITRLHTEKAVICFTYSKQGI